MEKSNSDNRIVYLDILRMIVIYGVILIHVSAVGFLTCKFWPNGVHIPM